MKRKENKTPTIILITEHMEVMGLKYSWLCSKIGISNGHFSNIKSGLKNLTPEINSKINKILGTDFKL